MRVRVVCERGCRLELLFGSVGIQSAAVGGDAQVVIRQRDELVAEVEHATDGWVYSVGDLLLTLP